MPESGFKPQIRAAENATKALGLTNFAISNTYPSTKRRKAFNVNSEYKVVSQVAIGKENHLYIKPHELTHCSIRMSGEGNYATLADKTANPR
jgi:hypothetical protein